MYIRFRLMTAVSTACLLLASTHSASALVTDPGFENYAVDAGDFTQVPDGAWTFNIYTTGVTEPYTTEPAEIWRPGAPHSATFAAYEGSQYISAYAGAGSFTQAVTLSPGEYELSVWAASPGGLIDAASHDVNAPGYKELVTGAFRFLFDEQAAVTPQVVGPTFEPVLDAGWVRYSTTVEVTDEASYLVGVDHQKTDTYFINYDMFQVTPVPEPGSLALLGLGGLCVMRCRRG